MNRLFFFCFCLTSIFSCKTKDSDPQWPQNIAFVISGASQSVEVIDLSNQLLLETFHLSLDAERFPHHIYLSPDGERVAIANPAYDFAEGHEGLHGNEFPGGVLVLNAKTGRVLQTIEVPFANHNASFSPDGTEIWTTGFNHSGRVYIYDANDGTLKKEIILYADPSEIFFSTNGLYAVVRSGESTFLQVIEVMSKEVIKEIKVDISSGNVWPGYDDIVLVSNASRKSVNFVDLATFKVIDFIDFDFKPGFLSYNKSNEELWVCNSSENKVNIFKKQNNVWMETRVLEFPEADPHMLKFYEGDKKVLLINQKGNSAVFIDADSKAILKTIPIGHKPNGIVISQN